MHNMWCSPGYTHLEIGYAYFPPSSGHAYIKAFNSSIELCFNMSHGKIAEICHVHSFSFSFSLPLVSLVAYSLLFHTQPASVVEKQGGAVHLQCLVHPASAKVTWFFQGRALEQDLPPGVVVHPDKISLPSLQPQNTGTYQCVAHSGTGSITSQWARVTIAGMQTGKKSTK